MKKPINLRFVSRVFNLGNVQLITSQYGDKKNVATVAWLTPIEKDPPLVMISLDKDSYTFGLIDKSGEFVLNTPTSELLDLVKKVGSTSGRDIDKFKEFGIRYSNGQTIQCPVLDDCVANVEFIVRSVVPFERHAVIMGVARYAVVEEELFSDHWLLEERDISLIHHAGSTYFCTTKFLVDLSKK
jgi:flavin reductase (DIM6/NTAB) family NADH-FMN oxidoreductase RutF